MLDMHSHILPGFDDGARNGSIALAMLSTAKKTGTRKIIATPHIMEGAWIPLWSDIIAGCRELQNTGIACNIDLAILPGAEVALDPNVLKLITEPGPYCINGGRYMLVELPPTVIPFYADEFLFSLQVCGINPIIAHPERHPEIRSNYSILEKWIRRGILVQINGPSLIGKFGDKAKAAAENLLKLDMVHCIGSDAHNDIFRSPDLSMVRRRMVSFVGGQRAERILVKNPKFIINNQDIGLITHLSLAEGYNKKSIFS